MEHTPEEVREFWDPIIRNEDGSINEEQLYKELADFSHVMDELPKVYMHITDGRLSKITYFARTVASVADECYRTSYIAMVREFIDHLVEDGLIKEKCKKGIVDQIEIFF